MPKYTIDGWMVGWTPMRFTPGAEVFGFPGAVEVGPWPDKTGWSRRYPRTAGCCESARRNWPLDLKIGQLFVDFHTLVVRDRIDPQHAHAEFLKIDEYMERISPDLVVETDSDDLETTTNKPRAAPQHGA
jgi:hypothetical protein